jgi:hypothetical protein
VFSPLSLKDGDVAPLKAILALCERYRATLFVDECHGATTAANAQNMPVAVFCGPDLRQCPEFAWCNYCG